MKSQAYPRSIISKILGNACSTSKVKPPIKKNLQRKDVLITGSERREELKQKQKEKEEKQREKEEKAKRKAQKAAEKAAKTKTGQRNATGTKKNFLYSH